MPDERLPLFVNNIKMSPGLTNNVQSTSSQSLLLILKFISIFLILSCPYIIGLTGPDRATVDSFYNGEIESHFEPFNSLLRYVYLLLFRGLSGYYFILIAIIASIPLSLIISLSAKEIIPSILTLSYFSLLLLGNYRIGLANILIIACIYGYFTSKWSNNYNILYLVYLLISIFTHSQALLTIIIAFLGLWICQNRNRFAISRLTIRIDKGKRAKTIIAFTFVIIIILLSLYFIQTKASTLLEYYVYGSVDIGVTTSDVRTSIFSLLIFNSAFLLILALLPIKRVLKSQCTPMYVQNKSQVFIDFVNLALWFFLLLILIALFFPTSAILISRNLVTLKILLAILALYLIRLNISTVIGVFAKLISFIYPLFMIIASLRHSYFFS